MTEVWIVSINGHVNSVWRWEDDADEHVNRLKEVNGDQLAVKIFSMEVRERNG